MSTDEQIDPRGVQRNRPKHVDALASTVVSVLRDRQGISSEGLRQFVLDHLIRAVLDKGAFLADAVLLEMRGYRLTVDAIIDLYVPAVARQLGQMWVGDSISFADVTIGSMRLQSLISEASATNVMDVKPGGASMHTLVLVPQGEQHFLGASVLAGQLRRMGCEVDMSFDEDMGTLTARMMNGVPDMILMSCSRREILETIASTVQVIRKAVSDPPVLAVGGAFKVNKEYVAEKTGADIVTSNAEEAVAFCGRRRHPANPT